jgi:hypothetical protein
MCSAALVSAKPVQLHVRAVNPFTGEVYVSARITVKTLEERVACESRQGIADCELPAGTYVISAHMRGFGSDRSIVQLTGPRIYRKVGLWLEEPIDYGRPGALTAKLQVRRGRILRRIPPEHTEGYWIRIAAIHDGFQDTTFTRTGEVTFERLRPGLYQVTVSDRLLSKSLLLSIHDSCVAFNIPFEDPSGEVQCH